MGNPASQDRGARMSHGCVMCTYLTDGSGYGPLMPACVLSRACSLTDCELAPCNGCRCGNKARCEHKTNPPEISPDKADATVKTGGKSGAFLARMNIGSGTSISGVDLDHRNRSLKWAYCPPRPRASIRKHGRTTKLSGLGVGVGSKSRDRLERRVAGLATDSEL